MLDIKFIRENKEKVKKGIAAKGYDVSLVDRVLDVDKKRTTFLKDIEEINRKRKIIAQKGSREGEKLVSSDGKSLRYDLYDLEERIGKIDDEWKQLMLQIPNLPLDDVPIGKDETSNKEIRKWGKPKDFNFKVHDYQTLSESLGIIDMSRAAKISGSRFGYLVGDGALLEFAIIQYAISTLVKYGFIPIIPPALIKPKVKRELGYMEHGAHENWYLVGEPKKEVGEPNFYLIGTAEHAIVPYYKDEILQEKQLPRRFVAFSPSFRREAGTYGRDTKGIFRVHQFDKVEMVSFTSPKDSSKEHDYLLSLQEKLVQGLGLPYRVVQICSAEMAFPTARQFDIEIWFPSEGKYRETHSTSNTTDFQARRLNIKYLPAGRQAKNKDFVHILNATAAAIGRTIIAILENYQQKDGSILVPKILQKYTGFSKIPQ